ncbi:MAG TPA: matrixin family metalloprotease, partial [Amaricoccus sp.]
GGAWSDGAEVRRAFIDKIVAGAAVAALLALPAAAAGYRLLEIDGLNVKWGEPLMRSGAEVSYGFAAAEVSMPGAINCRALAPIARLAAAWERDPERLAEIAAEAFGIWSREADLRFRPAAPGEPPDILIGAQGEPDRIAFANVWHGTGRQGIAPLTRAAICFNPLVAWSDGEGPDPAGALDLPTVLAHEIGHAIGLDHPGATGALMGYSNQGDIDHLMPGDVAGAVALYGPARD